MKQSSKILIPILIFFVTYLALNLYSAIIITAFYIITFLVLKHKEDVTSELVVAIFFALFVTSYHHYKYTGDNLFIGAINVYPLVLWSLGLVLLRELYEYIGERFWLTSFIYIVAIFSVEYIGFHWLKIQLVGNKPGIFGLDVIHGPVFVYYFYVLAGPIYLWVTKILKTP